MQDGDILISVPMSRRAAALGASNAHEKATEAFVNQKWKEAGDQWKLASAFCFALEEK